MQELCRHPDHMPRIRLRSDDKRHSDRGKQLELVDDARKWDSPERNT